MLKGIDPLLNADVLYSLARMGHGDTIVIADANFPATSSALTTVHGTALHMDCDSLSAVKAILSLMPLDTYVENAIMTMQVVNEPHSVPAIVREAMPIFEQQGFSAFPVERFAFYAQAKQSFAIIQTAERRPYGNFILRKGVL